MNLLSLITAVETFDDKFYHGDVHADTVAALKELVELREVIDGDVTEALTDIEVELNLIRKVLNRE